jgi:hypothetical protein
MTWRKPEAGYYIFPWSLVNPLLLIKDAEIARVDLVYSDYPSGHDFTPLNTKRLESLQKILPDMFGTSSIDFRKVRQTIAKTKATAEGLQHGFFIYFRHKPTREESKTELKKLKEMVGEASTTSSSKKTVPDSLGSSTWCGSTWILVDTTGLSLDSSVNNFFKVPASVPRIVKKWATKDYLKTDLLPTINAKDYVGWDSVYRVEFGGDCPTFSSDVFLYQAIDSTVSTVLKRKNWKGDLVVADVTGSMYPYTGQLLKWLKLTLTDKAKRYFVFFNDGDDKDDRDKVIGKTGGIYSVWTNKYDEVEATITKAMTNGSGGDAPENNIEALLESDKLCTACDSVIMIVDNWAPVKDISLLDKSHRPVKVIVCGVLDKINKDYLKLVRDTKGSLHLMEEDIYNLAELKEGEMIKIHGVTYKLVKGEFVTPGSLSL